jgi:uncharacterized protein
LAPRQGYACISREWSPGDAVDLSVPLKIELLEANPNVMQSRGEVALRRGPLIYCLEQHDISADLDRIALAPTTTLTEKIEPALLGGITVIRGRGLIREPAGWEHELYRPVRPRKSEPVELTAVPYCVWGNRGQGRMKVWIDSVVA